jgi:hypothetical protein
MQKTDLSRVVWKRNGKHGCRILRRRKQNCAVGNNNARTLSEEERQRVPILGSDLRLVWTAPTTTDRDRKELLRTLLEEVILNVERKDKERQADLTLRWRGGMITKLARRSISMIRVFSSTMAWATRFTA